MPLCLEKKQQAANRTKERAVRITEEDLKSPDPIGFRHCRQCSVWKTLKEEFLHTVRFSSAPNTFRPFSGFFQTDGGGRVRKDLQTILRGFGLDLAIDLGRREKFKLVYLRCVSDKRI